MTVLALDTSFLIDFLAGDVKAIEKMKQIETEASRIAIPSIVVYELLILSAVDRQPERIQQALNITEAFLSRIGVIWAFDAECARRAAEIQRTQFSLGRPISVRDLFITATAFVNGCTTVITRNIKDFSAIEGIIVESY